MSSQFDHVPKAAADPSNDLAQRTKANKHPLKVDLGVGVYKNEQGGYYEIPAISKVCIMRPVSIPFSASN